MSAVATAVGSGNHTYEVHEDWARLPEGWEIPAASVTVDSKDRVYCFSRSKEHPVIVFDRDGNFLSSWGAGLFAFPHTIRADKNDNLWLVDRDHAQMMLFTSFGTAAAHHRHQRLPLGHGRGAGRFPIGCLAKE